MRREQDANESAYLLISPFLPWKTSRSDHRRTQLKLTGAPRGISYGYHMSLKGSGAIKVLGKWKI